MGNAWHLYAHPEVTPDYTIGPTFDTMYGFKNGRKERVMIATKEEMVSAGLPLKDRDYCAHILLEYRGCRKRVGPLYYRCAHERHEFLRCEFEDYVLRMKEYERERRLKARRHRLQQQQG